MNDHHEEHDRELVERLRREARDYNAPPPTPREAMWARIEEARRAQRGGDDAGTIVRPPRRFWRPRRIALAAAVAAMLVIAFLSGRKSAPPTGLDANSPTVAEETPKRPGTKPDLYRMAAAPVLDQAELLLTQFRTAPPVNGEALSFGERASALLVDTRYLLNSPAADDPELNQLLSDLELVLAQIVRLAADGGHEKEWVDESMENRSLLPRLRAIPETGPRKHI